MRARVFLWSTPGLALMKHFAILSSNTYEFSRGVFFHLGTYSFLFRHVFLQLEPTLDYMKQTNFIFTHPIMSRPYAYDTNIELIAASQLYGVEF